MLDLWGYLLCLSILEAIRYLHWIKGITFLSMVIFGIDIVKKVIQVQAPESKQLVIKKSHIYLQSRGRAEIKGRGGKEEIKRAERAK